MKSTLLLPLLLLAAATGCASTTASSRQVPRVPAPPATFFSMAAASMDRFEAWANELDVPAPEILQRGWVEANFPLIGEGGLRRDGPMAMFLSRRLRGARNPAVTLVFPLTPGTSPIAHLLETGAQPVPGSPGVVVRRNFAFREVDGFLITGPDLSIVTALDVRPLLERLARPGTLAEADIDLARWRTTDPGTFHDVFGSKQALHYPFIDSTGDRLRLTLSEAGASVRLAVEMAPIALGDGPTFPKPGFPSGLLGRVDFVYPTPRASRWMLDILPSLMDAMEQKEKSRHPERAPGATSAIRPVFEDAIETLWTADAMSMAIERSGSQTVYHQVNQYRRPANFTARVQALVEEANRSLDKEQLALTSYAAGGATVSRISSSNAPWTVDFVDSGTTVRMVIAGDAARRLPGVLAMPAQGAISSVCAGTVDPGALLAAFSGQLPPSLARVAAAPLSRDGAITWTSRAEGNTAVVELSVSKSVARLLGHLGASVASKDHAGDKDQD